MASERDRISSTMGSEESLVRALLVCSGVIPSAPYGVLEIIAMTDLAGPLPTRPLRLPQSIGSSLPSERHRS